MSWTRISDLRAQVQKLWDKGELLGATLPGNALKFPLRLRLSGPTSTELTERFDEVRAWMTELQPSGASASKLPYRILLREFRHRVLGSSAVPSEVWLDSLADAFAFINRQKVAKRFAALVQLTQGSQPQLMAWLQKRPLQALALADAWPRLLAVVGWLQAHPRPGIYLRQVDLPGVDSKFIEAHRSVLAELLDLALPVQAIDVNATGASQFCRRYGFADKPLRVRFRLLGDQTGTPTLGALPSGEGGGRFGQDITITQSAFEALNPPVGQVFITENEVNFLAFPVVADSLVIFGAGYGFEALAGVQWLHACSIHYWGDIDTHGFAILDQLRTQFPHVHSLLMDEATLQTHAAQWVQEPQPLLRNLPRLTPDEASVFNTLRDNRFGQRVRLEQERIGFGWVQRALAGLATFNVESRNKK